MRRSFKSVNASSTRRVQSDVETKGSAILGVFEGECADSNITNKNGLDITREVWETVFNSDEYKEAIELGFYIGFLGHPDDPGCMDFEHACIVMTEGHIDDNGKVYGKFNLVDTPVGRIVKTFIDAGVTFGISVRGAGDIIGNSVDPETFVFRGFDIVTFPAFPESIPTFTEIAASSDIEKQRKYKRVCETLQENLDSITSCQMIDQIQGQFAKQSKEYKMLESKRNELVKAENVKQGVFSAEKLEAVTNLYAQVSSENAKLRKKIRQLESANSSTTAKGKRIVASMKRICASQLSDMQKDLEELEKEYQRLQKELDECISLIEENDDEQSKLRRKIREYEESERDSTTERERLISASQDLERQIRALKQEISKKDKENQEICASYTKQLESLRKNNLIYKQKISHANSETVKASTEADDLYNKYVETVSELKDTKSMLSNLDSKVRSLQSKVEAKTELAEEYRRAYIELYCNATGIDPNSVYVKANTGLDELKTILSNTTVYEDSYEEDLLSDGVIESSETYDASMLGQDIETEDNDDDNGSDIVVW